MAPMRRCNAVMYSIPDTGLLYFNVKINDGYVVGMIDTGASHSFISDVVGDQVGLKLIQGGSSMKAVNTAPIP
ncbi:hypothetical protein FRX31_015921, partial [Thalictrum thalictroides]